MMRDTHELAWAAGFFDGEGCIGSYGHGLVLQVTQVDRRALDRLVAVWGFGTVTGPWGNGKNGWSTIHRLSLQRFEHTQAAIAMMWPWIGPVKREQIKTAITAFLVRKERRPARNATVCQRGHSLDDAYVVKNGHRRCRRCEIDRVLAYQHRKKVGSTT